MAATIPNQSLTPTKLDSSVVFSPSNYPDKRSVVAAYKRMVQMVLESAEERAALQKLLKDFHSSYLVEDLMEGLKVILNAPRRRQLYLAIRALIPNRLRAEYNSMIPHIPSFEKKVAHLKQVGSKNFGFTIRGGKEFACGIYVTSVLPSSKAAQCGLKAGDEVVRVNGLMLAESTHEEVVNLIKLKKTLTLSLKAVGMVPENKPGSKVVTWMTVEGGKGKSSHFRLASQGPIVKSTKRIQVSLEGNDILGASIKTDKNPHSGVFIEKVVPNSPAHNAGLRVGDEIMDVNGHSLLNVPHSEAIRLLKSSNSLMLTTRVNEVSSPSHSGRGYFEQLSDPPADFELRPNDFDIDAELVPVDPNLSGSETGFFLRPRLELADEAALEGRRRRQQQQQIDRNQNNTRLSLLDMDTHQSRSAPVIASPAAEGWGPTLAMPTLMGMMPQMPTAADQFGGGGDETDAAQGKMLDLSIASSSMSFGSPLRVGGGGGGGGGEGVPMNYRESVALDMSNFSGDAAPNSIAALFSPGGDGGEDEGHEGGVAAGRSPSPPPPPPPSQPPPPSHITRAVPLVAPKPKRASPQHRPLGRTPSGQDIASFQFPVDEEEEEGEGEGGRGSRPASGEGPPPPPPPAAAVGRAQRPSVSAMKKDGKPKNRSPAFSESVQIISVQQQLPQTNSSESFEGVHPSNMEFSDQVLQGRYVAFHTIPKDAPIKIAIRGGTDTPTGPQILISRILEGGAAERYGKLNVGDQILVCDGFSMIDVTHDEAAQALKRAMDMDSNSIDLVVAVNPDAEDRTDLNMYEPKTMWPLPEDEDTVLDQAPPGTPHDFARSSHRSHSGFTLRGHGNRAAGRKPPHAFLPRVPGKDD